MIKFVVLLLNYVRLGVDGNVGGVLEWDRFVDPAVACERWCE